MRNLLLISSPTRIVFFKKTANDQLEFQHVKSP